MKEQELYTLYTLEIWWTRKKRRLLHPDFNVVIVYATDVKWTFLSSPPFFHTSIALFYHPFLFLHFPEV